ncbi:hypothetical protein ACFQGT_09935 [Natrialbaceae archaeon GCM10025810]|uniref:hypothetical protein n=1 Tax=Halovalidus salilacus TaxID=3075124 RepID=UPI0036166AB8
MEPSTFTPRIVETRYEQLPLLPGLAKLLKERVSEPELKVVIGEKDENGDWCIDESLEAYLWYPGGSSQTCISEVICDPESTDNYDMDVSYYQIDYHAVPLLLKGYSELMQPQERAVLITQINNCQLQEWLTENGVFCRSERIIEEIRQNEAIRNKHGNAVERTAQLPDSDAVRSDD